MNAENQVPSIVATDRPARVIGILGMHRSGTSCLTGTLQEAGLFLGEHHTWNHHNRKGNRENQSIVDIHEDILSDNGGAWDNPPKTANWKREQLESVAHLLAEHRAEPFFGFKDPRALLLLEGWKGICPDIEFVGIFRHPNAVAGSLHQRNSKPHAECLELWYAYNSILYAEYLKKPFPVLNFDEDEAVLDDKIMTVAGQLGLPGREGDEKFYNPELRHNAGRGAIFLPRRIRRLYKQLKKISL